MAEWVSSGRDYNHPDETKWRIACLGDSPVWVRKFDSRDGYFVFESGRRFPKPPLAGPFPTLEAAQLAAEILAA